MLVNNLIIASIGGIVSLERVKKDSLIDHNIGFNLKSQLPTIRLFVAECLTFVSVTDNAEQAMEMHYEDESIWLTQKIS